MNLYELIEMNSEVRQMGAMRPEATAAGCEITIDFSGLLCSRNCSVDTAGDQPFKVVPSSRLLSW